jgi:hypothetical protein
MRMVVILPFMSQLVCNLALQRQLVAVTVHVCGLCSYVDYAPSGCLQCLSQLL